MVKRPPILPHAWIEFQTPLVDLLSHINGFSDADSDLRKLLQKSYLASLSEQMAELKTKVTVLQECCGGAPHGASWKKDLKASLSWPKVEEAFKMILKNCDAEKIERELEVVKEESLCIFLLMDHPNGLVKMSSWELSFESLMFFL